MECLKCHFKNPDDTRFCGHCGESLHPSKEKPPHHEETLKVPTEELTAGSTFAGRYQLIEELGRGGMGVVYKAKDIKLNRIVALKFLPPELTCDVEARERFLREAQAASRLDHNNICTVHEVDEVEGQTFIAMAYIDGESIKKKAESGPLKLDEALDIAIQISEGLQEAHEKDIVHRDIKSANIMTTTKGISKIMDFGLAKLAECTGVTKNGTTLGTVSYMSPEQARGEKVDHRTDIWSLGVILYEMVAGQLPFKGANEQAVIFSVLNEDPEPISALRAKVPMELERILTRALSKEKKDRYQTAIDMQSELQKVKSDLETKKRGVRISKAAPKSLVGTGLKAATIIIALILVGVLSYLLLRTGEKLPRLAHPFQITSAMGVEDYPSWSPESGRLAYQSNQSGNWDIWIAPVGGGPHVNRTADYAGTDMFPSWSPDGNQLAFWSDRDGGGYFLIPALAGVPRKVMSVSSLLWSIPQWSKDGRELACVIQDAEGFFVEIVSLNTGESRRVPLPGRKGNTRFDLSWSPDGNYFAYVDAFNITPDATQLWILQVKDGVNLPITEGLFNDWSPSWSPDGKYLYFVSNRGGSMDLWQQRIGKDGQLKGSPQAVTTGIGMRHAIFSSDGTRLAYSKGRLVANLWKLPIKKDRPATWAEARQITSDQAFIEFVDISPDGKHLLFSSDRGGNQDIWMMPVEGGEIQQLTTNVAPDWAPAWSPDGMKIAFYSARSGNRDIWLMAAGGGPKKQMTWDESTETGPVWSPDGKQIAFASGRRGNMDIWVIPAEGGEARQLTVNPGNDDFPRWSPDGKWLLFRSDQTGESHLWRVPASGGSPSILNRRGAMSGRWSPDGKKIYFISSGREARNIWEFSIEDGRERRVMDLSGRRGNLGEIPLAIDGRQIFFSWEENIGDLWVVDISSDK
jgi:Tol biopolymer transport system component/predicted Ser/Thr protein kinase